MLICAVDTALQRCSVAICRNDAVLAAQIEDREKGHAERIAPMAAAAFDAAGVAPAHIDRIGVIVGPGGFTGVRVGLSFARALGLAIGAPVVGVDSLTALAGNVPNADWVAPFIDARRGQVYAALFHGGDVVVPPFVDDPALAAARCAAAAGGVRVALVGSGAGLVPARDTFVEAGAAAQIDPAVVARCAAAAPAPTGPPAPLYLRAPDAKKSL